jgi:hypothetical protein
VALEGDQPGILRVRAVVGMPADELERLREVPLAAIAPLLDPGMERDGVVLTEREDAEARVDPSLHDASRSRLNGRGARAWRDHALCSYRCATAQGAWRAPCGPTIRPTGCCPPPRCCAPCGRSPTMR